MKYPQFLSKIAVFLKKTIDGCTFFHCPLSTNCAKLLETVSNWIYFDKDLVTEMFCKFPIIFLSNCYIFYKDFWSKMFWPLIVVAIIYHFPDATQSSISSSIDWCHSWDCRSWRLAVTILSYKQLNSKWEQNQKCLTQQAVLFQDLRKGNILALVPVIKDLWLMTCWT